MTASQCLAKYAKNKYDDVDEITHVIAEAAENIRSVA